MTNVNLRLQAGEIGVLIGASGEGKSTLLKIMAGLQEPASGEVLFNGEKVKAPSQKLIPGHDQIKFVAQDFELMPYISTIENIYHGALHLLDEEKEQMGAELLRLFDLEDVANQKARTLSGGQQQRVALAKALMANASLYLFDEVFSQLDMAKKMELMVELKSFLKTHKKAALFVLHSPLESFYLADVLLVLANGNIEQKGTPTEVYNQPKNEHIAHLFGRINVLPTEMAVHFLKKDFRQWGDRFWFRPSEMKRTDLKSAFSEIESFNTPRGTMYILNLHGYTIWVEE